MDLYGIAAADRLLYPLWFVAPPNDHLWRALTHLGDFALVAGLGAIVALWLLLRRHRGLAAWFISGLLLGQGLSRLLKALIHRERPHPPQLDPSLFSGPSFPSGHTTAVWIFALLLVPVLRRTLPRSACRYAIAASGLAIAGLVSASRLALGVHWTSDVVGGILFALLWVGIWRKTALILLSH